MSRLLAPLALVALLLAAWEIAVRALGVPAYFLPPPSAVAVALKENFPVLVAAAWRTLATALIALVTASLIALIEPAVNTVAFYFHDLGWHRLKPRHSLQAKTSSFALVHFSVAFGVAYLLSGELLTGGVMALIEPAINTVVFFFHERLWRSRQPLALAGV